LGVGATDFTFAASAWVAKRFAPKIIFIPARNEPPLCLVPPAHPLNRAVHFFTSLP
jgi:hypothetical protein